MSKKYCLLAVLMLSAPFIYAQQKLTDNLFLKKLSNGLNILVVEDHSVPLVTLMMTFKAGSFTESDEVNGLTGLYQLMLGKGNKDYANQQAYNYHSGQLGINLQNNATSTEYATSYFTLPSANFKEALDFMNSAVRFPKLDPEELEKEKEITNNSLKQKESNPYYEFYKTIDQHLWGNLYSRKRPTGNPEVINAATVDALEKVKDKYYYPNNALLIVGGDITHETVFQEVEKIYGDWRPSAFDPAAKWPVPEFKPLAKQDYFIVESKLSTVPSIAVYWQGPDTRNDVASTYAADVFSYIINQNSSQLNQALVKSGLATSVGINYLTLKYVGPISLIVTPNPAKVRECMAELKKQIALMDNDDYLSADKIETAKRRLEIKKVREEEITSDYVHSLSFWWASASLKYFLGYNDNLQKVTQADIKNYIRKYIKNRPYCAGLLINPDLSAQINAKDFFKPTTN